MKRVSFILILLITGCEYSRDWNEIDYIPQKYRGTFKYLDGYSSYKITIGKNFVKQNFEEAKYEYPVKIYFQNNYNNRFSQPVILCIEENSVGCEYYYQYYYRLKDGMLLERRCFDFGDGKHCDKVSEYLRIDGNFLGNDLREMNEDFLERLYNHLGVEKRGVSYDDFKTDIRNEDFQKRVYNETGVEDGGISFGEFRTDLYSK